MTRVEDETRVVAMVSAAPGWWAVWRDDAGEVLEPVAAWALIENGGLRWASALVPDGEHATSLGVAELHKGYCGLRYFAPGAEPMRAWASDKAE